MNLSTERLLDKAKDLRQKNQLQEAIETFELTLEIDPQCQSAYQQLGDIYWSQQQLEKALLSYERGVEIDPDNSTLLYNMAEICKSQNRHNEAAQYYIKALQVEPFNNSPFIQLMYMQLHPTQLDDLVVVYQQLSQTKPNNPWVNVKLGNVLTKQKKIEAAIASYQTATYKMTKKFNPDYVAKYWHQAEPTEPSFIIIGPMKTATSALYEYINNHPLVLTCIEKEVHFFNDKYKFSQGKDWYVAHFPLIPPGENFITGEASPGYIVNNVQNKVFDMFPRIKPIALIRNPIDRAFSHYQHNVKHGFERRTFTEVISTELEIIKSFNNPSDILYTKNWQRATGYVLIGFYYYFLKQWLDIFPPEQFLIVDNQDLLVNPEGTMQQVFSFLSLSNHTSAEYPKYNSNSYQPLEDNLRQQLAAVFRPHNQKLEQLLNRKLNWD